MKIRLFKILTLFIIVAMFLGTACQPQVIEKTVEVEKTVVVEKEIEKKVEIEKDPGGLTIWANYDITGEKDPRDITLRNTIDTFQSTTGIKVNYEQISYDTAQKKLAIIAQSGGEMPDVVQIAAQHVPGLMNAGALMDILPLVENTTWYKELHPAEKELFEIEGGRWGVGLNFRGNQWYYNVADFPNGWPTKAEDWATEGERLKKAGKYLATGFYGGTIAGDTAVVQGWVPLFQSKGGHVFDAEGKPDWAIQENVEALTWFRDLLQKGYISESSITGDWAASEEPFVEEVAASVKGGTWGFLYMKGLQQRYETGKVKIGPPPGFDGKKGVVNITSQAFAITSKAQNVENALAWLNFVMNPNILIAWSVANFGVPVTEAARNDSSFNTDFRKATADNLTNYGLPTENSPYFVESIQALTVTIQEIMLKPELDIMTELEKSQKEVIEKYWE